MTKTQSLKDRGAALSARILGGSKRFRSNFVRIASASVISQGLNVVMLPVLSRLYSPQEFGLLTTYMMVHAIFLSVVSWRSDWLLPNVTGRYRGIAALQAGVLAISVTTSLLAVVLLVAGDYLLKLVGLPAEVTTKALLVVGVLTAGLQLLFQSWYVREGTLGVVGVAKLSQTAIVLVGSLIAALAFAAFAGLVYGYVAGFVGAVIILRGALKKMVSSRFRLKAVLAIWKRNAGQLATGSALGLVNIFLTQAIVILLVEYYSQETVGAFGLVFRVAMAPMMLISMAIMQSFWSDAVQMVRNDPPALWRFYTGALKRLATLACPLALIFLAGPLYVPFVFGGERWAEAGVLLAAVTPYLFGIIIFSPTTHLIVYGKAHWQLAADLVTLILAAVTFSAIAKGGGEAWTAILGASIVLLLGYIVRFFLHFMACRQRILLTAGNDSISYSPRTG
jgi:O-antigen/teichoic acid export membrane protein